MPAGLAILHKTVFDKEALPLVLDYSKRHEIVAGQKLTGTATVRVLLGAVLSTDLTVSSVQLDSTSTQVLFTLTDVAAVIGNTYTVTCSVNITSGPAPLVESIDVLVTVP
jgi:hypothetical protein